MKYTHAIKSLQTRQLRSLAAKAGVPGWGSKTRTELILALQLRGY